MKLKQKLAEEHLREMYFEAPPSAVSEPVMRDFISGFEKARELAVAILKQCHPNDSYFDIELLGEEEDESKLMDDWTRVLREDAEEP